MKKSGNQKSNGKGEVALKKGNEKSKLVKALHCWQLYVLLLPALIWLAVFAYYPMYGLIIAFKDFKIREGILASPWAEPLFKHFIDFFSTSIAMNAIKNTIILSLETLVIGFPIPVIFALLLNQIQRTGLRKTIQTITYAPYFMSERSYPQYYYGHVFCQRVVNNAITNFGGKEVLFTSAAGMVPAIVYRFRRLADHGI